MSNRIYFPSAIRLGRILSESRGEAHRDLKISSCCGDAANCQPGDVFVALDDGLVDGHEMVYEAIDRGAAAVVAERLLPIENVPQFIVDDTRVAFGRICHALAGSPSSHMCSIGITGTYGKTMTELLAIAVLESAGCMVGAMGSLGNCDGFDSEAPGPATNAAERMTWLARMSAHGCSHAVIEASSEALATKQLSGIEFNAAIITNICRAHINLHGSVANYRRAKAMIFEHLKPGGSAILNADDPGCQQILSTLSCPVLTYSMKHDADVTATLLERVLSEQTFLMSAGTDSMPIRTTIIGDQHIQNCLAAACLGLSLGIDLPVIARGLEAVASVPGRMERVECGQDFGVFIDQGTSPELLAATMSTLREVTPGRLFCVMGPSEDVASVERARLGSVLERFADEPVLTSPDLSSQADSEQIHDVLDGFDRPAQGRWFPSRTKAICWALGEAQPGDTVLIAGNASEAPPASSQENARWNDRDIAKYWLIKVGAKKVSPWMAA